MGKAFQGVYGSFSGKVGNVVGRIRQGVQVYSIYQPSVANPRTPAQLAARERLSLVSRVGSALIESLRLGFRALDGYKTGSPYSSFVGYNLRRDIVAGTYPSLQLDYSKMSVAQGVLALPFNLQGSLDSLSLNLSWADNSTIGNALATDVVSVAVYNKSKALGFFSYGAAGRSERTCNVVLPSAWSGDAIEVWAFFSRADNSLVSDSQYVGSFTI